MKRRTLSLNRQEPLRYDGLREVEFFGKRSVHMVLDH